MAYGTFKTVSAVARKFKIKVVDASFVQEQKIDVPEHYFVDIAEKLGRSINFINEYTICEAILRPILEIVTDRYENLDIWSHVPYNVDADKGLIGEPDYLISPLTEYGDMARPALCVMEAKQEKFEEGWAQALAEMVASSLLGAEICYSVVSTGKAWEFGRLQNSIFTKHPAQISATTDLQTLFDTLNWLFEQASLGYGQSDA